MGFVVAFVFNFFCLICMVCVYIYIYILCVACHMCLYENKSLTTSVDHRKHLYHFTWLWLNCSIYMNSFYNAKVDYLDFQWRNTNFSGTIKSIVVSNIKIIKSTGFGRTWVWVNHWFFIFGWTVPLRCVWFAHYWSFIYLQQNQFPFMQSNLQMRNTEKQKQFHLREELSNT